MERRWKHPLFKPSRKSSRDLEIFSTAKRLSPIYFARPEISANINFSANAKSGDFGQPDRLKLKDIFKTHRFSVSASVVFLVSVVSIFVFALQTKFASAPSIYASSFSEVSFSELDPMSKESFLRRLTEEQTRQINSQVHYVAHLINNHRVSNEEAKRMAYLIVRESLSLGYDPLFITAVIKSESTFRKHAVSPVGATGLMQIMPDTGRFVSKMHNVEWNGVSKLRDPHYNIKLGIAYLKYLDEMFKGDREKMLVAYNWGPANVLRAMRNSTRFPSSCVKYARSIITNHGRWNADFNQKMAQYQYLNLEALS